MEYGEYMQITQGAELEVCTGDLIDGLDIDLVKYSGIGTLSDEQHDKLWAEMTDINLVEMCDNCELLETGEWDSPGQSTVFYSLITEDQAAFQSELRNKIMEIIQS